jgi:diketogulonate reductase-like aldo/keto reductase
MTATSLTDTYTLANDVKIPMVGFGTWQTPDGDVAYQSVLDALAAGYRHIDTAAAYGNEESVGRALKDSGLDRGDIFVTSKLWNADHGYEETKAALAATLKRLDTDYLDLYLIHWPNPKAFRDEWAERNAGSWRAMEEAYEAGKVRAIGVSNFQLHHIEELMKTAKVAPMVNQLFVNPSDLEEEIVSYNNAHNILTEAYSPLGTGKMFEVPALKEIADKNGKSVAQVALRWSLQHGFLPLPKSTHKAYIEQNGQLFDFVLSDDDMATLDGLTGVAGTHTDPDKANF